MSEVKVSYVVKTQDVDGANSRKYKSLAGAVKRFEEMVGYPVQNVIEEMFWDNPKNGFPYPKLESLTRIKGVSMFGTVVGLYKISKEVF